MPALPEAITEAGAEERAGTRLAMGHFGLVGANEGQRAPKETTAFPSSSCCAGSCCCAATKKRAQITTHNIVAPRGLGQAVSSGPTMLKEWGEAFRGEEHSCAA